MCEAVLAGTVSPAPLLLSSRVERSERGNTWIVEEDPGKVRERKMREGDGTEVVLCKELSTSKSSNVENIHFGSV